MSDFLPYAELKRLVDASPLIAAFVEYAQAEVFRACRIKLDADGNVIRHPYIGYRFVLKDPGNA